MNKNSHLTPVTEKEIIEILDHARTNKLSVSCFSAGFNWGYGTKEPIDSNSVQIDLSKMNKIISFDNHLGILKVEPGVTQGQLEVYLKKNNHDFYVPNNGAGKRASLVGNALERGFGIAPIQDHASSILSIRGILSDGSIYESALREIDSKLADCFSWGVGPQLDKLVTQSSWIIVTEMSIQLKRRHEFTDIVLVSFSEDKLEKTIDMLRNLMSYDDANIGSIKIFNRKQIINQKESVFEKFIFHRHDWFLTIVVYSNELTRSSFKKLIKKRISKYLSINISVFNESKIKALKSLLNFLPKKISSNPISKLNDLHQMLRLAMGHTSEVGYRALDLEFDYENSKVFNFDKFDKKLIWLSPICPFDPEQALKLMTLLRQMNIHPNFKFNTFTWTVLNQRTLAMVVPIIYDEKMQNEFWIWYKKVHLELKSNGFIPYRFHNCMMEFLRDELLPKHFLQVKKIEGVLDPESLFLKGRYFKKLNSCEIDRMYS